MDSPQPQSFIIDISRSSTGSYDVWLPEEKRKARAGCVPSSLRWACPEPMTSGQAAEVPSTQRTPSHGTLPYTRDP